MKTKQELEAIDKQFQERMKRRRDKESESERLETERLQQDYLKRTGRTEMKP